MPRPVACLSLIALLGCAPPMARAAPIERDAAVVVATPDVPRALPTLHEPSVYVDLAVPGYGDAVLVVPVGATGPRPVVVLGHGNYDRPEWECRTWRYVTHGRAFVLCPRGLLRNDVTGVDAPRFTFRNEAAFASEANAGLAALRARYPDYVAAGPVAYVGFSLGAIFGPGAVPRIEGGVSQVALVEGGYDGWTASRGRAFRARGGTRILFVSGQSANAAAARRAIARLAGTGVETLTLHAPAAGHSYGGGLVHRLPAAFDALVAGDPRFAP